MAENLFSAEHSDIAERINALPALRFFGAKVVITALGEAVVTIDEVRDFHTGGLESSAINGMTLMGLLDSAMCVATLATLRGQKCATVDMSVKFLKPVLGQSICASGKVISRSKNLFFCEASIHDSRGRKRVVATGLVQAI
jgi:uncharacterized protein (TIGR00369 family)